MIHGDRNCIKWMTSATHAQQYNACSCMFCLFMNRRIIFLETVAGVPGMVGAMSRHLLSLRRMRRDHAWIHTLLGQLRVAMFFNALIHGTCCLVLVPPTHYTVMHGRKHLSYCSNCTVFTSVNKLLRSDSCDGNLPLNPAMYHASFFQ